MWRPPATIIAAIAPGLIAGKGIGWRLDRVGERIGDGFQVEGQAGTLTKSNA